MNRESEGRRVYQTRSSALTGRRIRLREARADFDGYIAELLSKALSQAQLDQPLTTEDRESREHQRYKSWPHVSGLGRLRRTF